LLHICLTFNIRAFFKKTGANLFSRTFFFSVCVATVLVSGVVIGLIH
jgi:hypothetical protein